MQLEEFLSFKWISSKVGLISESFSLWLWYSKNVSNHNLELYLKVSKNQKQIFQPKLLPKTNHRICFPILISSEDRKTNSLVRFLEKVLAGKFVFDFCWPLNVRDLQKAWYSEKFYLAVFVLAWFRAHNQSILYKSFSKPTRIILIHGFFWSFLASFWKRMNESQCCPRFSAVTSYF